MASAASATDVADLDADHAILRILERRIQVEKRSVGMAVAVVKSGRKRFVTCGRERLGDTQRVTPDTVFEIGSITKVFTALLLADMSLHGELALDDPVTRHLPPDFPVAKHDGREVTLADLATHTSGLPRLPDFRGEPFSPEWNESLARYSIPEFKTWVAEAHPPPPVETGGWWYSNAGYALLAMALEHRGGRPFETLLYERVIHPLGLRETTFHPTSAMSRRLAEGHNPDLTPSPPNNLGIFAAAGALRSTPRDMARFAAAVLPGSHSRIEKSAQLLLTVQRKMPWVDGQQALGWEIRNAPGGPFITKDGVTWGQTVSMVFDTREHVAVVVFSNTLPDLKFSNLSSGGVGAADIAYHLIRPQIPMNGEGGIRYYRSPGSIGRDGEI